MRVTTATASCPLVVLVVMVHVCAGQEVGKKAPEPRRTEVLPTSTRQELPTFDVPKFVITGNDVYDLPVHNKLDMEPVADILRSSSLLQAGMMRDRETLELANRRRERLTRSNLEPLNGRISAGVGTFFTPAVDVRLGQVFDRAHYSVGAAYDRTNGFDAHTERSAGSIAASGATVLSMGNSFFNDAELRGNIGYHSSTYRFYGSAVPAIERTVNAFKVSGDVAGNARSTPWNFGMGLRAFSVADSSANVSETEFNVTASIRVNQFNIPWEMFARLH
ncbi:MAG: hypothetical protein HY966_03125, partial [Ignavibacteriales bacterium]|nr:hypothetical protein [Ignavibacteriales bacterium]